MKLYHFCAAHLLPSIQREGLTLGCTPVRNGDSIGFLRGHQWLTANGNFLCQPWNGMVMVKYDRAAYRITVSVPESARWMLRNFETYKREFLNRNMLPDFDADPDCANWYVFVGRIKPSWFREIVSKKEMANYRMVNA